MKISNGMGRRFAGAAGVGIAAALTLALFFTGCAKQESTVTAQAESHAQTVAQADLPEVIVTASRDVNEDGTVIR